ncbi:MAG: CheR family methyltransferase [Nitrospirota bacterium]
MSQTEFNRLSEFIYGHCGIKMPPVKKIMLEARLQKRLRCLGMQSYAEYCNYLFKSPDREKEYAHMIDCVTTNKTDFFREPIHFQFLSQTVLPEFMQLNIEENLRPFLIWSAGCSSGEEPYTLAMVLSSFAARCQGFQFSILASDISTKVLEKARTAIYPEELVASVPFDMKQKYLLRGKDKSKRLIRIVPDLRDRIQFQRINLMDEHFLQPGSIDVIFCRNVIIYFDRLTQNKLLERLCSCLKNGGYLFLGHSETIHGFNLPLTRVSSTIYRKER